MTDILLDEVARAEKINITNQELNYELAVMAQMYRTTPKQIYKILNENRQLSGVATNVLHRKVTRFIIDNAAKDETEKPVENKVEETAEIKTEETKKAE